MAKTNLAEQIDERVLRRREAALRYRRKNIEKVRTYARERMRQRRASDPDGERDKLRKWKEANPERVKERKRHWHHNNPDSVKNTKLKCTHGITLEQWDEMFEKQGRACAICKTDKPNTKGRWFVDHCHTTERRRGILCGFCNAMLGYAKDNPGTLANAIDYLRCD